MFMEVVELPRAEVLPVATFWAAAIGRAGLTGVLVPGFEGDLIVAAGDPGQDLTVLHDLRLWWSSAEDRRGRAGFTCAYFPLRGTG